MKNFYIYSVEERKILHLLVGYYCNNNCIFCMEDDREGRYKSILSQREDIPRMIISNKDVDEILFTCGEPTLNEELINYIKLAKSSGIKIIGIISNGRRFAYKTYAEELLKAGINCVTISIHGHNSKLHNSLTRTKGAFEQTFLGLRNLSELKNKYIFKLQTATTISKINYQYLNNIYYLIAKLPIDKIIFNMITPQGRGAKYFNKLIPRISNVIDEVNTWINKLTYKELDKIFFIDFPYCVTESLPDITRGYIESFIQYESIGSRGGIESKEKDIEVDIFSVDKTFIKKDKIGSPINSGYYFTSREFKEEFIRIKRQECYKCKYNNICHGIWKLYINHFEWDEFVPVMANKWKK